MPQIRSPPGLGPRRVGVPRPACTHVDMDRVYGVNYRCHVCGRRPSLRWVYMCRQDERLAVRAPNSVLEEDFVPAINDNSPLRNELQEIGLSESIIAQAEQGLYTDEQLDIVIAQKLRLKQVIAAAMKEEQEEQFGADGLPGGFTNGGLNGNSATLPGFVRIFGHELPRCTFTACHTCRPYFKDRVYMSIESMIADEFPPVSPGEATQLPKHDARKIRNIKEPQKHVDTHDSSVLFSANGSQCTIQTTQSEIEHLNEMKRGARAFYKLGSISSTELDRELPRSSWRKSLKFAFLSLFGSFRDSSSDGSTITLPLSHTGTHRSLGQEVSDFDLSLLKRVRSHRRKNLEAEGTTTTDGMGYFTAQGTAGSSTGGEETTPSDSSDYSYYSGVSEQGSEVEVDGGVALTEEAVETHTPDIVTTEEGLQSIMTQV